jgi:serine phosphatase RsbU (regulator of sigma subunit)
MASSTSERFWRGMSRRSMWIFIGAVFFTFATIGFITDMQNLGRMPRVALLLAVLLSGGPAVGYALNGIFGAGMRQRLTFVALSIAQFALFMLLFRVFPMLPRPQLLDRAGLKQLQMRIVASGVGCIFSLSAGYALFIVLINREGARYFRMKAEMDLAAEIHKQLVPPIAAAAGGFEFYGRSEASSEVGGDLIDVVVTGGSEEGANEPRWVAYIADVAGHGVAPGVVMGMVKSAARMQLTAPADGAGAFLDRLNAVLYPLRAPQMFVTFAYVAAAADGLEYGVAGHPAILHATAGGVKELASENLPLGILPENRFITGRTRCAPGDLLLMLTDGLLEVEDKAGNEFGGERVKELLQQNAGRPLEQIAGAITGAVQQHGGRNDDQSLLLIRCRD